MRKFSYFILGIILLFVAIFVITPYFIGAQLQKHVNQHIVKLEHQHPAISITVDHYNRHWFSSDINFTVNYRVPFIFSGLRPGNPISLKFNAHIEHGPIISYTVDGKKIHQLGNSAIFLTNPKMQGEIISIINWRHHIHTVFEVEHFTHQSNTTSITIKNLNGYLDFNHMTQHIDYDIKIGHFKNIASLLPNVHDAISTANSELKGSATKHDGLWVGKTTFKRENTRLARNNTLAVDVKDLTGTINSHIDDDRVGYQVHITAADVALAGQQLGALSFMANLNNVNAKIFSQLIDTTIRLHKQNTSLSDLAKAYQLIFSLTEKGLTFNIQNFSLSLPDSSPISLTASLQFIAAPQGTNFLNALKYMSANAQLNIPREFVQQQLTEYFQNMLVKTNPKNSLSANARAHQTIQQWINNQLVIPQNDSLHTSISIKEGNLLVNDKKPNFEAVMTNLY